MSRRHDLLAPPAIGRYWLLGALVLVLLPHLLRFPLWLAGGCAALLGWRLLHELRGWPLPGRGVRWLLTLLGIGLVLLAFRTVIGRDGGVALLAVMLCLKLLEIRTLRDAMIAIFIGYFLVISGFLFSQSLFMGAYLFAVVLALTAALAALNHPGQQVRDARLYLRTGGALLLQALPLMVVMFLLFPRLSGPLWSMPKGGGSAITGLGDSIRMGTITQLAESAEVAFRVTFDGPLPAADTLYWRGPVLWQTDGRSWQRGGRDMPAPGPDYRPLSGPIRYTVTLEPHDQRWLFALELPTQLPLGEIPGGAFLTTDYQLLSRNDIDRRLRYDIASVLDYRMDELSGRDWERALQLPEESNPRSRELAARWRAGSNDDAAVVQRALRHFAEQPFYYTRTPPALGDDPVDEFMFQSRQGFCEHFAAAFVTLMRAADVPARVVTGYQGGELNELGDYLIIRQSNAHAWAEVWLDGRGWVRVDPTAAIPPERVVTNGDTARFRSTGFIAGRSAELTALSQALFKMRHGWDALNNGWNQWVLGFDQARQARVLRALGLQDQSWRRLITLMVALLATLLGLIALILLLRRPRQRDPVLRLYQRFCQRLERSSLARRPDEGPRTFAARVIKNRPELDKSVSEITALYEALRYGRNADEEQLAELKRQVAEFRP